MTESVQMDLQAADRDGSGPYEPGLMMGIYSIDNESKIVRRARPGVCRCRSGRQR